MLSSCPQAEDIRLYLQKKLNYSQRSWLFFQWKYCKFCQDTIAIPKHILFC